MKYKVTPELSQLIKTLCVQNGIAGIALAKHIDKSPVYVSKLENGVIKNIEQDLLIAILDFVVKGEDFFDDKLPLIAAQCELLCGDSESMLNQFWLMALDSYVRPIYAAGTGTTFSSEMSAQGLSKDELVKLINGPGDDATGNELPDYVVEQYRSRNKNVRSMLKMTVQDLDQMLDEENPCSNYSFIHAVAYTLRRLKNYAGDPLTVAQKKDLWVSTEFELGNLGIRKQRAYSELVLSDFIVKESDAASGLMSIFEQDAASSQKASGNSRKSACSPLLQEKMRKTLEVAEKNVEWDESFMIKLLGLPFNELGKVSYSFKKSLLDDAERLLEEQGRSERKRP